MPDELDEPEPPQPEWLGPPRNYLGAAVPVRLLVARTDEIAVAVTDETAYPTGFDLTLSVRSRRVERESDPWDFRDPFFPRRLVWAGSLPPEVLRFGLEFSDGAKATNVAGPSFSSLEGQPEGPLLTQRRGGGGGGSWDQDFWVWPLPPEGPLAFVCEWPSEGIPVSRAEIDADVVRLAAARAERLWDDPGSGAAGGWTGY